MRNIFDQYGQPENRLTHALLTSLAEDPGLLRRFMRNFLQDREVASPFEIYEQSLPGERLTLSEDEAEKRGLPDGCIVDGSGRTWLIESKIAAHPTADQLQRHRRTAVRRQLRQVELLVLTTGRRTREPVAGTLHRTWSEVYRWLQGESSRSTWAARCARYFEIAEVRLLQEGYKYEGTLTVFTGIPFGSETPYQYAEAKRHLDLLRRELLNRPQLIRQLGIDPNSRGRPAVTGSRELAIWDYISLKRARGTANHTKYPHLTIGLHADRIDAYVTVPNGVSSSIRSRLFAIDANMFADRVHRVTAAIDKGIRRTNGLPRIGVIQRRYRTQRAVPTVDATLRFDPRTAFPSFPPTTPQIKQQPQWLDAVYSVMTSRNSNLQFQIGAEFPYHTCPILRTPKIVDVIERVWLACAPFVNPD